MFDIDISPGVPGKSSTEVQNRRRTQVYFEVRQVDGGAAVVEVERGVRVRAVMNAHPDCADVDYGVFAETRG
jgi:hypothetical protein